MRLVACDGTRIGHFSTAVATIAALAAVAGAWRPDVFPGVDPAEGKPPQRACASSRSLGCKTTSCSVGPQDGTAHLLPWWYAAGVGLAGPVGFGGSVQSRKNVDQHSCRGGCRCRRCGIEDLPRSRLDAMTQGRSQRVGSQRAIAWPTSKTPRTKRHLQNSDRDRSDHRCSAPRARRPAQRRQRPLVARCCLICLQDAAATER